VYISVAAALSPLLPYTIPMLVYDAATSGVIRSEHTCLDLQGLLVLNKRVFKVTLPCIHCAYVDKWCGHVRVAWWLDVTGMYPKYDRRVQISSLYSEEQRVCICFLLCSQSLWLFRERVVSTEHFPANAGGFCEHLPCLTLLCHLLKD